jgi:SAM-dependent methyltransferase
MTRHVDLFNSTYSHFTDDVLDIIRKETFGNDIGQNSWLTAEEYDRFIPVLNLQPSAHVIEIASGSGGPALYLSQKFNCRVTGVDANESGIATATQMAKDLGGKRISFQLVDANRPLPFADNSFDGLVCIDSMNHFPDRLNVLKEWQRVLRPGHRALFTDPVVITGPVTNEELATRSLVGLFLFVPPGINEELIADAGFKLVHKEDVTRNAVLVSDRWRASRDRHRVDLIRIEGEERFEGLQQFFAAVHRLTSEGRLSRIMYFVEK